MKRTFVLNAAGLHVGVKFAFDSGNEYTVMLADLVPAVRAHAECNGIGEALRDTGAGKSDAEAEAAFLKRLDVLKGGEYSARGGSRLDWVGDILEAIGRIMAKAVKTLGDADIARIRADLDKLDGTEAYKKWLSANPTRKAIGKVVDAIRKERAADRAKAATSNIDIGDII